MDLRTMLGQVRQAFVIGKGNPFLHGRQGGQQEEQAYEPEPRYAEQGYAQQAAYQAPYQQQQVYQQPYPPQQQPYQPPAPGAYQPPYQQAAPQQGYQQPYQAYQQPVYQPPAPSEPSFQTQISPDPLREGGRQRRSAQHQEMAAPQQMAQPPENVVPFPGAHPAAEPRQVDAYVINVFNIASCRQAMSCLRKGQCTLIVMDQLIDKTEIRRYVDMLTGACYALNGTMTRLSAKIGFYIMAPSGMTVYTDPTTSNANAPQRPAQTPLYRAPTAPGSPPQRPAGSFAAQAGYELPPQMNFAPQSEQQPQAAAYPQAEQQPAYDPYAEQAQPRYQAQ